mmetsp:Transcript_19413/g.41805  ORF Transcript_19413/g.41805 Transcript_19413/m.41805 type:complete len:224 (+) Transcript_19413:45-716(+)
MHASRVIPSSLPVGVIQIQIVVQGLAYPFRPHAVQFPSSRTFLHSHSIQSLLARVPAVSACSHARDTLHATTIGSAGATRVSATLASASAPISEPLAPSSLPLLIGRPHWRMMDGQLSSKALLNVAHSSAESYQRWVTPRSGTVAFSSSAERSLQSHRYASLLSAAESGSTSGVFHVHIFWLIVSTTRWAISVASASPSSNLPQDQSQMSSASTSARSPSARP